MMVVVITTSLKGHFLNYFEILKSNSSVEVKLLNIENLTFFRRMINSSIFIYNNYKKINRIIILNGDQDIILSLIIKLLFPFKCVKTIIYYTYQNQEISLFKSIKKLSICFSAFIGIEIYLLEYDIGKIQCLFSRKNFKKLYDPILANETRKTNKDISEEEIAYLLAGYIDDRKCVKESIEALEIASVSDNKKRKLIILGEQSPEISEYLNNLQLENLAFTIKIQNYRFTDDELNKALNNSDVIWAIYKEHFGSSGMVINAILYNKKVLFIPLGVLEGFSYELKMKHLPFSYGTSEIYKSLVHIEKTEKQYSSANRRNFISNRVQQKFSENILS